MYLITVAAVLRSNETDDEETSECDCEDCEQLEQRMTSILVPMALPMTCNLFNDDLLQRS